MFVLDDTTDVCGSFARNVPLCWVEGCECVGGGSAAPGDGQPRNRQRRVGLEAEANGDLR